MKRPGGFLLIDLLLVTLLVCLCAAATFRILADTARQASETAALLTAAGAAEATIDEQRALTRSLTSAGAPADDIQPFRDIRPLAGRDFETIITKEVIDQCPGFHLWTARAQPAVPAGQETRRRVEASMPAAIYDPF